MENLINLVDAVMAKYPAVEIIETEHDGEGIEYAETIDEYERRTRG